jgi:hypothetical protein
VKLKKQHRLGFQHWARRKPKIIWFECHSGFEI